MNLIILYQNIFRRISSRFNLFYRARFYHSDARDTLGRSHRIIFVTKFWRIFFLNRFFRDSIQLSPRIVWTWAGFYFIWFIVWIGRFRFFLCEKVFNSRHDSTVVWSFNLFQQTLLLRSIELSGSIYLILDFIPREWTLSSIPRLLVYWIFTMPLTYHFQVMFYIIIMVIAFLLRYILIFLSNNYSISCSYTITFISIVYERFILILF